MSPSWSRNQNFPKGAATDTTDATDASTHGSWQQARCHRCSLPLCLYSSAASALLIDPPFIFTAPLSLPATCCFRIRSIPGISSCSTQLGSAPLPLLCLPRSCRSSEITTARIMASVGHSAKLILVVAIASLLAVWAAQWAAPVRVCNPKLPQGGSAPQVCSLMLDVQIYAEIRRVVTCTAATVCHSSLPAG